MLHALATFGFVVAAPHACSFGCFLDDGVSKCDSLPEDPHCFGKYYYEQLAVFDFAATHQDDPAFANVDLKGGFGVAGHSMGGQATIFSSAYNATQYNIKASVMHHAYTHSFPPPQVPFAVFTGTDDTTAPAASMAVPLFASAAATTTPRALVNKVGAGHHEPDITGLSPNSVGLLAQFTAAWFKLFLDETQQDFGLDFQEMIFGSGPGSVCGGGDGPMQNCTVVPGGAGG